MHLNGMLNLISIGIKKDQMICLATDMRVKFKYSLTSVILPRWDRHLSNFKSDLARYGGYALKNTTSSVGFII